MGWIRYFGAHRFYTENYRYASAMLLTSIIPIFAIIIMLFTVEYYYGFTKFLMTLFIFFLVGSVIWSWIDAFFLNKRIDELNDVTVRFASSIQLENKEIYGNQNDFHSGFIND